MAERIIVYGADWCGDTRRTLRHLDRKQVSYDYIDIDEDDVAEKRVIEFSNGKRRIPLVEIASDDGEPRRLAVPSDDELDRAMH